MKTFKQFYLEMAELQQKSGHMGFEGKVFVYYNINLSEKLGKPFFSIQDLNKKNKKKVIGHSDKLMIRDAILKVSESGRERVNVQKRKNVHAGIVGYISEEEPRTLSIPITYNPYKHKTFVKKEDGTPVHKAKLVSLIDGSVTAENIE